MTVSGVGIHTGDRCIVHLHRVDGPTRFLRNGVEIPASLEAVDSTLRCTSLASGGERIAMVEHLLAALRATGWWSGVAIEASGVELPILDGSAAPWLEPIASLGAPPPAPSPFAAAGQVAVERGLASVRLDPGPDEICCHIAFDHPSIGPQSWCGGLGDIGALLSARTFGFLHEAEALRRSGLGRGASAENAIVFSEDGPLRPLRTPYEPVRHKALDLVGDLYLLQRPLSGRVTATRGSHALHIDFMRALVHASHARHGSARSRHAR